MPSDLSFVEYVCDQIGDSPAVSFRKMFGEFALYHAGKVVALICDNQLFVKPTEPGRAFLGSVIEAPPYPGAKLYFVADDQLDDSTTLLNLIRLTAAALPAPKEKVTKAKAVE